MKLGSILAMILMLLVAIAHALRLLLQVDVSVGTSVIPAWVSVVGIIVPAVIALLLWRERPVQSGG